MLNLYLLLLSLIVSIFHLKSCWSINSTDYNLTGIKCKEHCRRLLERSLDRIGYSLQKMDMEYTRLLMSSTKNHKIDMFANSKYYQDICWKYFDFGDCNRKCDETEEKENYKTLPENSKIFLKNFIKSTKLLIKSCKASMENELLANFRCIHKYHTFLEVQCSSYAQEAVLLRKIAREDKRNNKLILIEKNKNPTQESGTKKNIDRYQETCRFLHYHSMCLSNSIFQYCPTAKDLFNRFTIRDFFLSFVLPMKEDYLFSDTFLDHCQLYDFAKIAKDIFDSTKKPTTKRSLIDFMLSTPPTTKFRKIFSSDEDLEDTPPNFYYSSAKYEKDFITYATSRRYNNWDPSFTGSLETEETEQPKVSLFRPLTVPAKTSASWLTHHHQQPITVTFPDQQPSKPAPYPTTYKPAPDEPKHSLQIDNLPTKGSEKEYYSSKWSITITKADAHPETTTIHPLDKNNSVVIDVFTGNQEDYYYSSTENIDDYESSTQTFSIEATLQKKNLPHASSDLFPIVFPVTGEKASDTSTMHITKYSVSPDNVVVHDDSKLKPNVSVTRIEENMPLVVPTPLFTDSGTHVKKIIPFDKLVYDNTNNNMLDKQNTDLEQEDGLGEIDSQIEEQEYYEDTTKEQEIDYTPPYTIITTHPDDFMNGKNFVGKDSAESYFKTDPENEVEVDYIPVEPVSTPYYANTLFVLFAIYTSFFLVTIASLACLLLAYVLRNRNDRLKASWIFFEDQERF